jgi:hypothetical protein
MAQYKSLYEILLDELEAQGKIREVSPDKNIQILQELNEGMEDFVSDQRIKERHSEIELASIVLM